MSKLIQKYMSNQTQENLNRMKAYFKKHPFSILMITKEEAHFLAELDLENNSNPLLD